MSLLPAVIPQIPETRSEVVPARLARKVAPLFGVPWPDGPFEGRTWVCDYGRITLSEIARGAPLPTRKKARDAQQGVTTPWQVVDRVAVTGPGSSLPHEIANTTLNRFGPDTKAAVVLTAVNRLLAPVTDAVGTALSLLVSGNGTELAGELRLAAWAGLVAETFRSQPALVAAAIRARTIQRELIVSWQLPLAAGLSGFPLTRCEIGGDDEPGRPQPADRPRTLDVADETFKLLRMPAADGSVTDLTLRLLREETVDLLLRRLLATGTPNDASYLWLSERAPDQLAVEALVPPTGLVDLFVRQAMRSLGDTEPAHPVDLPRIPTAAELAPLPVLSRRAVIIGLLTVLRHVQHVPSGREVTRYDIVPLLATIGELTRTCLTEDDPVAVLARCRVADMTVQTLRHDLRNDLRGPLDDLRREVRRVQELTRAGAIDRGAAAEAISSANVEINIVRWTNAEDTDAKLPTPGELHAELRHNWAGYHDVLELHDAEAARTAGYHLHNYAAFLASPPSPGSQHQLDLAEAVRLFADAVIPAREAFFTRTGSFQPLRHSLQIASRATTRLAQDAFTTGDTTAAIGFAGIGLGWIHRALADPETVSLLDAEPPTELAVRLALLAAPALLVAIEAGVPAATQEDLATARRLVEVAQRWEDRTVGDGGVHSARHGEVVALQERLDALAPTQR